MDFNDDEDSFLDIVSKGLVIFMMILAAFLLSWVFGRIWAILKIMEKVWNKKINYMNAVG